MEHTDVISNVNWDDIFSGNKQRQESLNVAEKLINHSSEMYNKVLVHNGNSQEKALISCQTTAKHFLELAKRKDISDDERKDYNDKAIHYTNKILLKDTENKEFMKETMEYVIESNVESTLVVIGSVIFAFGVMIFDALKK